MLTIKIKAWIKAKLVAKLADYVVPRETFDAFRTAKKEDDTVRFNHTMLEMSKLRIRLVELEKTYHKIKS